MTWVRCPNCGHKMFLYDNNEDSNLKINIKCTSCKKIVDVTIQNGKLRVEFDEKV